MDATEKPVGFIYGLRLADESVYRHVGLTEGPVALRLRRHFACARRGERKPVYDWMREHGAQSVVLDVLETVTRKGTNTGAANPNYGKTASAETRAKRRAAQLGIPKPSSVRNAHTGYHTNKGIFREGCRHCADDALAAARTTGESAS